MNTAAHWLHAGFVARASLHRLNTVITAAAFSPLSAIVVAFDVTCDMQRHVAP